MSDYLCEDLVVKIFSKLSPKSVLRFRSLSKSFCSRISSHDFIRGHTFQSPSKFLIRHSTWIDIEHCYTFHLEDQLPLCRSSHGYNDEKTFEFPYASTFTIVGSCNGILCVYDNGNTVSLWNPSIRYKLNLPYLTLFTSLYFKNRARIGFGFNSVTYDYKIVLISYSSPPRSSIVYTMKTGTWSEIAFPTSPFNTLTSHACFVNGAFHWLANCDSDGSDDVGRNYIMTFDLSTHVFGTIALPEPNWGTHQLAIMKGYLAVISSRYGNRGIWLRGYKNTPWYEVYNSKTTRFIPDKIFEVTTHGNILLHAYYRTPRVYNFETGVLLKVMNIGDFSSVVDIEKYVETLELLDIGKAYEGRHPYLFRQKRKSTVEIITPVELTKKGDKMSSSEAALLAKNGIPPVFSPDVLDLTEDDLVVKFSMGVSILTSLALAVGYPTIEQ